MGNKMPCNCSKSSKGEEKSALVLMEDGSLLKLKKGAHAKRLMKSHRGYCLVKCSSDRAVLRRTADVEGRSLYFLLPESSARCSETYRKMWRLSEARGLLRRSRAEVATGIPGAGEVKLCGWTPELKTIPEIASPPAS